MKLLGGKFEIKMEEPGRLYYREGLHDYVFPIFEQDRQIVIVPVPSTQRFQYFFKAYFHPKRFSKSAKERIAPRLLKYFEQPNRAVKLFENLDRSDPTALYQSLFDERNRASRVLEAAGLAAFRDYCAIELIKETYGLEVCGIKKEDRVQPILVALQRGFPQWHFSKVSRKEEGMGNGWKVAIHMFRKRKK